jgi:UDP-glucose 4-epimerase
MAHILVTGGAGYIGSFMVRRLLDDGYAVTVIDSLERGHKKAIDPRAKLKIGSVLDKQFLSDVFSQEHFEAVLHFAAYISVNESTQKPDDYFRNNTLGSFCLFEQMRLHDVMNVIFSSTATVYGTPQIIPIPEEHQKNPENPYGESKLLVDQGLDWYRKMFGLRYVILRYFNAAGAALDGSNGEDHSEETHLVPNAIKAAIQNKEFSLFGTDYKTRDGTAMRDYIHVLDLVEAHILALHKMQKDGLSAIYNVGTGKGYTNREVIEMVKNVSHSNFSVINRERRAGDSEATVADSSKIQKELHFKPQYSDLKTIISSAWQWHENKSNFIDTNSNFS